MFGISHFQSGLHTGNSRADNQHGGFIQKFLRYRFLSHSGTSFRRTKKHTRQNIVAEFGRICNAFRKECRAWRPALCRRKKGRYLCLCYRLPVSIQKY